jgi:palmitoyltransferase
MPRNVINNFIEVFGSNPLKWFIPLQPNTKPILD